MFNIDKWLLTSCVHETLKPLSHCADSGRRVATSWLIAVTRTAIVLDSPTLLASRTAVAINRRQSRATASVLNMFKILAVSRGHSWWKANRTAVAALSGLLVQGSWWHSWSVVVTLAHSRYIVLTLVLSCWYRTAVVWTRKESYSSRSLSAGHSY